MNMFILNNNLLIVPDLRVEKLSDANNLLELPLNCEN